MYRNYYACVFELIVRHLLQPVKFFLRNIKCYFIFCTWYFYQLYYKILLFIYLKKIHAHLIKHFCEHLLQHFGAHFVEYFSKHVIEYFCSDHLNYFCTPLIKILLRLSHETILCSSFKILFC